MKLKELSIEIIQRCSNNCLFCSSEANPYCTEKIDLATYTKAVSEAAEMGTRYLYISGGEPFLHEDLVPMVAFAKGKGMTVFLYTSGISLVRGKGVSLKYKTLRDLKAVGLDKIIFDVQTTNHERYDLLMGTKGRFPVLIDSIKMCVSLGFDVEFHFIPMKVNQDDLESVLKLASEMGVSQVSLLRFVNQGRGRENQALLRISTFELMNYIEGVSALAEKYPDVKIRTGHPLLFDGKTCYRCSAGNGKLVIRYDGDVLPCESFKWTSFVYHEQMWMAGSFEPDNVREKSLKDIYENSYFLNVIRRKIEIDTGKEKIEPGEVIWIADLSEVKPLPMDCPCVNKG